MKCGQQGRISDAQKYEVNWQWKIVPILKQQNYFHKEFADFMIIYSDSEISLVKESKDLSARRQGNYPWPGL